MANAFVISKANRDYTNSPGASELLAYKVEVDGQPVWVVTPHGNYSIIGPEVRKALDEAFPFAGTFKVLGSAHYRREDEGMLHMSPKVTEAVNKPEIIVRDGKQYRLVPID